MRLFVVICVCKHLAIIVFHCFDEGLGLSSVGNISRWIFRQRYRRGVEELPVLILKRVEKQYSALQVNVAKAFVSRIAWHSPLKEGPSQSCGESCIVIVPRLSRSYGNDAPVSVFELHRHGIFIVHRDALFRTVSCDLVPNKIAISFEVGED